jgi:hypothetical protein
VINRNRRQNFGSAAASGPRPGDFPLGSVESRAAARFAVSGFPNEQAAKEVSEFGTLSPEEEALVEGTVDSLTRRYLILLYRHALKVDEVYGLPSCSLTPAQIRQNLEIAAARESL